MSASFRLSFIISKLPPIFRCQILTNQHFLKLYLDRAHFTASIGLQLIWN